MPKVSVIIPVYNVEKYLGECLDSILGQTLRDIEVLCVDDGSTDGSAKILAEYATRDSRVKVFSADHKGAFRAREVGVKAAKGEYSYFMDADDMLALNAFKELCDLADREHLDQIVFASTVFRERNLSPALRKWARRLVRYYTVPRSVCGKVMDGMALVDALIEEGHFHVSPPLRIIRTSVLKDNDYPFPDATSRADNYFTPLSLFYSKRACALPIRYYRRRVRNDSISTEKGSSRKLLANLLKVMLDLHRFVPFKPYFANPDSSMARFMMQLASNLNTWTWEVTDDERRRILAGLLDATTPEERIYFMELILQAMREFKRRPAPTFLSCAKGLVKSVLCALFKKSKWFLR